MKIIFGRFFCAALFAKASSARLRSDRESQRELQAVGVITGLNIINNQVASPLTNGASLASNGLYNVQAVGTGSIGSVKFDYTFGTTTVTGFRTEGVAPYAFCGDSGGNYNTCNELALDGAYTITATPYQNGGGGGAAGTPVQVAFTIGGATGPGPAPVTASPTPAPVLSPVTAAPAPAPVVVTPSQGLPWIEDFNGLSNSAQTDTGVTSWTAARSGGVFSVQNGEFVVNDNGSEGVLTTGTIDISGVSVDVAVGLRSVGGLETNQDYVRLFAIVDGGAETLVGERVGVQNTATTITGTGITGNSLVLVVRSYVSYNNEYYYLDNLSVFASGTAPVPDPTPAPTQAPVPAPGPPTITPPLGLNGNWEIFNNQNLAPRHEACFVMEGDNGYLMGGRESRDVDIFSASSRTWSKGQTAPDLLHHMQCVGLNGKIYLPAAWTGFYPREDNADVMWVYDTNNDSWSSLPAMKESRRRGSAAIVVDGTKIWVSHGNRGGHEQGNFATSYGWIDYFDTATNTWTYGDEAGFPDAPNPRDHTGGGLVNGRICVSGGRDGGLNNWPAVSPTDCYNPATNSWTVEASIPQDRSGSSYGTSCDGKLLVAGGERGLSNRVDVFDGQSWSTFSNGLNQARHGSGLGVDCSRNLIYIASGSPNGGGGNTRSMEIYTP